MPPLFFCNRSQQRLCAKLGLSSKLPNHINKLMICLDGATNFNLLACQLQQRGYCSVLAWCSEFVRSSWPRTRKQWLEKKKYVYAMDSRKARNESLHHRLSDSITVAAEHYDNLILLLLLPAPSSFFKNPAKESSEWFGQSSSWRAATYQVVTTTTTTRDMVYKYKSKTIWTLCIIIL